MQHFPILFKTITDILLPADPMPFLEHRECTVEPGCTYDVYVETADRTIQSKLRYTVPGWYFIDLHNKTPNGFLRFELLHIWHGKWVVAPKVWWKHHSLVVIFIQMDGCRSRLMSHAHAYLCGIMSIRCTFRPKVMAKDLTSRMTWCLQFIYY